MTETAQLIRCSHCGVTNRVPVDKIQQGLAPKCGRCKKTLEIGAPITVTDATFSSSVESSRRPVLVDMWAPWCGPCRVVSPVLDEIAASSGGQIVVAKLNVDENPLTASRFNIQSIPSLLLIKEGREVDRMVGAHSRPEIERWLKVALS